MPNETEMSLARMTAVSISMQAIKNICRMVIIVV
jgi:hypothetical protein